MALLVTIDKQDKAKAPVLQKDGRLLICYAHTDKPIEIKAHESVLIPLGFSVDHHSGIAFFLAHPAITQNGLLIQAGPTMLGPRSPLSVAATATHDITVKAGDPVALLMLLDPAVMVVKPAK